MRLLALIVDGDDLLRTVLAAFAAGIGVTLAFSIGILGTARAIESNREHRTLASLAFAALAAFGFVATAAAVATGIALMLAG